MRKTVAPCGIDCSLCLGFQRTKNRCPGCNEADQGKPGYCVECKIKKCEQLGKTQTPFCYGCEKFPCSRLKRLDKRYQTRYGMSVLENLNVIETKGADYFIQMQKDTWTCSACGELLCVHRALCLHCGNSNHHFPDAGKAETSC